MMNRQIPGYAPMPESHATNAYDLLSDVIRVIQEEPKRLLMDDWLVQPDRHYSWTACVAKLGGPPACGTIGCVAGWVVVLAAPDLGSLKNMNIDMTAVQILLGEKPWHFSASLESKERYQEINSLFSTFPDMDPHVKLGTPEYVAVVVDAITAFQTKHEAFLRTQSIR